MNGGLLDKLLSNDPAVRRTGQIELDALVPASKHILIPGLVEALNTEARAYAATGLWKIGPAAIPALTKFLSDKNKDKIARHMAIFALEKMDTLEARDAAIRFKKEDSRPS